MIKAHTPAIQSMSKSLILLKLIKKEAGYYRAILELSRQEHEKLKNPKTFQEAFGLVKKRKILFSCIEEIESALTPIKIWWKEKRDPDHPSTKEIFKYLEQIDTILEELLALDQQNQKLMQTRLESLKEIAKNQPEKKPSV